MNLRFRSTNLSVANFFYQIFLQKILNFCIPHSINQAKFFTNFFFTIFTNQIFFLTNTDIINHQKKGLFFVKPHLMAYNENKLVLDVTPQTD